VIKALTAALLQGRFLQTGLNRNVEGRTVRPRTGLNGTVFISGAKTDEVAKAGYRECVFR